MTKDKQAPKIMTDIPTIFADITPVPQNEGTEPPVCSIAYAPEFIEAHDYLRALLRLDERSKRALELTTVCLKMNPANYTVWHYRRMILMKLGGGDIAEESIEIDLDFADDLGGTNPKNYQLWYHRRALLDIRFKNVPDEDRVGAAKKELGYVDRILDDDSKNYHAWSHRQWIIRRINKSELWEYEVDYSHSKILNDPRNNSAWNQRWFATHKGRMAFSAKDGNISCKDLQKEGIVLSAEMADKEVNYAICGAELDPYNESPWRYLIGVLVEQWRCSQLDGGKDNIMKANDLVSKSISRMREMEQSLKDNPRSDGVAAVPCISLMSALVDVLEINVDDKALFAEARNLCKVLAEVDPVRRKYWRKRQSALMDKIDT